jgi:hypothetical protein
MKNEKKKKVATATVAATKKPSSYPPVGGADALPSVGAPTPPINDNPVAVDPRKGMRVVQAEVNIAESAARELRASTVFPQILSAHFGSAEEIADAIEFAAQWYAQAKAGTTWSRYTQKNSNLSWNYALAMIDRLRASFQAVAATDPSIEKELPNFTRLLGVRQAIGAKGAVTRKKKEKSAKTSTTATAPAPAEAAPVTPEPTPVVSSANGTVAH